MTEKPQTIDAYISAFPETVQEVLQKIRATIRKAAPKAEECISYAIPAFKLDGAYIYFAGYKNHVSVYPAPREHETFKEELSAYKGGKGTVQFSLDRPVPYALITRIVKFRLEQAQAKQTKATKR